MQNVKLSHSLAWVKKKISIYGWMLRTAASCQILAGPSKAANDPEVTPELKVSVLALE